MKYKCEHCKDKFSKFQEKANHIRWQHKDEQFHIETAKKISIKTTEQNNRKYGDWIYETVTCSHNTCISDIYVKYRKDKRKDKYFCSRSCANSRGIRSQEFKDKISSKIKEKWSDGHYDNVNFNRTTIFSSKNERRIVKFFKENFPDDNWKSGGLMKLEDGTRLSRDLYSDHLKICFEYDGIWHFKDIHGQLKTKQHKDSLLEKWCITNGYRLIRVQDEFFENEKQIVELIYNPGNQIIKIGNAY